MKGWLITNAFLHTQKFTEIHLWLIEAAKKLDIEIISRTNAEVLIQLNKEFLIHNEYLEDRPDFVLFWDKDIRLANYLEILGFHLFNSSHAIAACDDKSLTHLKLQSSGINMPKTIIAPMTFSNIGYSNYAFLDSVERALDYPFIIKECFGSFGQQVYMVHNREEVLELFNRIGAKPVLFQEFIESSFGKDIRLQVVGNQVAASMYRYSENGDFRANITAGGKMKKFDPDQEQIEIAIKCCQTLGLDFAGVDILFGKDQEPIVCEVNSNAHFKNIYDCTGINIADTIMEYIVKKVCIG